jgi:hypothetical protein
MLSWIGKRRQLVPFSVCFRAKTIGLMFGVNFSYFFNFAKVRKKALHGTTGCLLFFSFLAHLFDI